MRLFTKMILAAVLFAVSLDAAFAAPGPTLNVWVKDQHGANVPGVQVAAIEFGMNGPSTFTKAGITDSSGKVNFTLAPDKTYNIYYSSHGYSPSISDQFNSPVYDQNRNVYATGVNVYYSTFTLTSGLTGVGRLVQEFIGATHNKVLFGGVYSMQAQAQAASGIVISSNDGTGFLIVDNVPYAEANTYNINLYDPEINRGIGRNVMRELQSYSPAVFGVPTVSYIGTAKLNFTQSIPPSRVDTTAQGGAAATGASVEGVVKSTGSAPIAHMGISVKACVGNQWNAWANSDDNGRFQLYGLTPGVTYYLQVMGGCTWSQNGPGACYQPYSSPNYSAQDICTVDPSLATSNDIVYGVVGSSDVVYHSVTLNEMPESTGTMKVCVRSSAGFGIPNANVNVNPDGSPWSKSTTKCGTLNYSDYVSEPGFSNKNVNTGANGCADLTGLPSGNYMLNVWTPFSSGGNGPAGFNSGPDSQFTAWGNNMGGGMDWTQAHCTGGGVDDYRININLNDSTNGGQQLHVYDSSGAVVEATPGVAVSSITYIVPTAAGSTSGLVKGTLKFPGITDLSANPILITLYPNCKDNNSCGSGNFAAINGTGSDHYSYTINVASGNAYYMNVTAAGWGRVQRGGGDNSIHLESTGTVTLDMEFARAGTITGTMYKPDGTIFTPANNQYIWVDAGTNSGWSNSQLQKDGTFALYDVLPGANQISIGSGGGDNNSPSFNYALPSPTPVVTVSAGSTSSLNLNLINANNVGIGLNLARTPDRTIIMNGSDAVLGFKVVPLPAGSVFKSETIIKMLTGGDSSDERKFRFSGVTGPTDNNTPCGNNWNPAGFCGAPMASPSVYDFYLMRSGDFGKMDSTSTIVADRPYPHFTMLSSVKNVVIDAAHSTSTIRIAYSNTSSSGVLVDLTPSVDMSARGNATLFGQVTAANFFRQADYESTGGDFDKFVKYLPVMSLYDANGAFRAAGIVVPPPAFIAKNNDLFNLAFSQGYPAFQTLLSSAGSFGYEIRALAPSSCYTAVLTTPNYPPYQSRVCVGVSGSTTTMSVNLDSAVGAGATVKGVVTSTNAAILSNVAVELVGDGINPRSTVTDAVGAYKFEGLPEGSIKIRVSMDGYALTESEKDLSGNNIYVQNFQLSAAGGSLTGTVYSQKLPFAKVQAGAQIYAYDDTYNGLNPAAPLPLLKALTGPDGTYKLTGLVAGDTYKVFLKVPGRYTLNQVVVAVATTVPNVDFDMLSKPLDIELFVNKGTENYGFTVLNPQDFKTGFAWFGPTPYNFDAYPGLIMPLEKLSSGELHSEIPLSSLPAGMTFVLHVEGLSLTNKRVTKEILFGRDYKGNSTQNIDDIMLGDDSDDGKGRKNNEASLDQSGGDPSALVIPAGALLTSTAGVVPSCSFKGEDKNSAGAADKVASLGADAFAGSLYTIALSSVVSTDRSIEVTLAYDKNNSNLNDLSVAQYNDSTAKWENVPGVATINPVKGTIKVKLKKLASVLSRSAYGPQAVFDGRQYVVRPQAGGSSSSVGTLAVIRPSVAGGALAAGAKLKVFNYPNPFNLKNKAIANSHGAGLPGSTYGTVIHVEVPSVNGGPGHIRIYSLAGELVRDLRADFTAGSYNYVIWDGKNKGGQEVANGVYYGVVEMSGKSPNRKDATFKMAVIK